MKDEKLTEKQTKRLAELHKSIKNEIRHVDMKEYSHNIISWTLCIISQEFGYNKANEAIDKFNLKRLGWSHETHDKKSINNSSNSEGTRDEKS